MPLRIPFYSTGTLRRSFICTPFSIAIITATIAYVPCRAKATSAATALIELELTWQPSLSAYTTGFSLEGSQFRGVVDTGSPFLTVKKSCNRVWNNAQGDFNFGCWNGEGEDDPLLGDTVEMYGSREGGVKWRRGDLSFSNNTGTFFPRVAFGIIDSTLTSPSQGGAVFFGLVKRIADGIRPSLLSEIDSSAFLLDFKSGKLILYPPGSAPTPPEKPIKFVDLRKYGSPVQHYAARVKSLLLDGELVRLDKPTYAILDTGCSGLLLSESMYARGIVSRTPRSAVVEFKNGLELIGGGRKANSSFLALPFQVPWFGDRGIQRPETQPIHVMSLGLAFFNSSALTVDTDRMVGWVEKI